MIRVIDRDANREKERGSADGEEGGEGERERGKMGSGKPKVRVIKRRYALELEGEPDAKAGRFYPPEDAPVPVKRKVTHGAPKLKKSLSPGSIVILLAGSFKGSDHSGGRGNVD